MLEFVSIFMQIFGYQVSQKKIYLFLRFVFFICDIFKLLNTLFYTQKLFVENYKLSKKVQRKKNIKQCWSVLHQILINQLWAFFEKQFLEQQT